MASLTTNLITLKENFYVRKKPDPISAAALPRGKPEKFGEIRERLWPGVHLPTDGRFIFSDETSSLTNEERFKARLALAKLPRNSSPTRLHNRCAITGRPKGYYRKLKMSRIALRELASAGEIPGMIKSSW